MHRLHRRLSLMSRGAKYVMALALMTGVGYADFVVGEEISFSIFYLLPIAFAAWFIDAEAGALTALMSAIIWYSVEVEQHAPYSHPMIPVWNASVRLFFFIICVGLVRSIRNTEARLIREVTRRTRRLRSESDHRRRLERELIEVTAREQLRLARDLHDGLGQYLSALAFHARMLSDDLRQSASPHVAQAERMVDIVRTTNQTIRRLDRALRLPDTANGGLPAAIKGLAAECHQLTGVPCETAIVEPAPNLDGYQVLMLFRIVQEALNNAIKHANPRTIHIAAATAADELLITVNDDGRGFDLQRVQDGAGLRIMGIRAELIGARLNVRANQLGGCTVECALPLGTKVSASLRS